MPINHKKTVIVGLKRIHFKSLFFFTGFLKDYIVTRINNWHQMELSMIDRINQTFTKIQRAERRLDALD